MKRARFCHEHCGGGQVALLIHPPLLQHGSYLILRLGPTKGRVPLLLLQAEAAQMLPESIYRLSCTISCFIILLGHFCS